MKPHTDDLPDLPFDPTVISDSELMTLFSTYVSWQNYLDTQLIQVEAELESAEHFYDYTKGNEWETLTGSATDKRVTIEGHDKVDEARQEMREAKKAVALVKVELTSAERSANLISRELSRRIGRENTARRENKWGAN